MLRNGQFGETELVGRAVAVLRDSVPARWDVDVEFVDATLMISNGAATTVRFAVEAKISNEPADRARRTAPSAGSDAGRCWIADYSFLNSNGLVLDFLAPRGLSRVLDQLRDRDDLRVTGSAAARTYLPSEITPVVPLSLLTVYAGDIIGTAENLGLVRVEREASNVIMTVPRDHTLLETPRLPANGLPVVPIGQVLADLLTLPGRFAQEAEQLIDMLARKDPTWSE